MISEFSKAVGYKINIEKSVVFLNTNNELSERKLRKQSHLQLLQKIYLRLNLIKVKNLYSKNFKTLKQEIEEDTNNWKHILFMDKKN